MATFKSTFYDTAPNRGVTELEWAVSAPSRGSRYGIVAGDDFALSAHPSTPYTLNIGPGTAWGDGVWDDVEGITTLTAAAPTGSATRWDLVCIRRDWQPTGGGPSDIRMLPGTTSQQLPSTREDRPGIVADQPLYLVQWRGGVTTPQQVIDLRCFAGPGGVEVLDALALTYLAAPGAAVTLAGVTHRYSPGANGVWGWTTGDTGWTPYTLASTPGVPNVRHVGTWVKIDSNCAVRIVGGGTMLHLRGEMRYENTGTPSYEPGEGVSVGILPPGFRPAEMCYILGTTNRYADTLIYTVNPNGNIQLGPKAVGKVAQFNGVVPLR